MGKAGMGERKRGGKEKERKSEGKEQRDGEREAVFRGQLESLQNPLLKPTIKFQPKLRSQYKD